MYIGVVHRLHLDRTNEDLKVSRCFSFKERVLFKNELAKIAEEKKHDFEHLSKFSNKMCHSLINY